MTTSVLAVFLRSCQKSNVVTALCGACLASSECIWFYVVPKGSWAGLPTCRDDFQGGRITGPGCQHIARPARPGLDDDFLRFQKTFYSDGGPEVCCRSIDVNFRRICICQPEWTHHVTYTKRQTSAIIWAACSRSTVEATRKFCWKIMQIGTKTCQTVGYMGM